MVAVIINKKIGLTSLCLVMILTGCTTQNSKDKKIDVALLKPNEVVEGFLKYYNQKNLEYIKVINVTEDTNQANKEVYLRQMKMGQIIDMEKEKLELENVTIFKVDFEVKYKKEVVGTRDSGKDEYSYTLIRKDKKSPWLISSFGH